MKRGRPGAITVDSGPEFRDKARPGLPSNAPKFQYAVKEVLPLYLNHYNYHWDHSSLHYKLLASRVAAVNNLNGNHSPGARQGGNWVPPVTGC